MRFKRDFLYAFFFSCVVFVLSYLLYPLYVAGDQFYYRLFYEIASSFQIEESFYTYQSSLGSSEPGYFVLVYILSDVLNKDILFSFINAIISFLIVDWMLKKRVSYAIAPLLLVNFYMLVLFFAADRLKVGVLFFLLAARQVGVKSHLFSVLSLLSHLQMLLPLIFLQLKRLGRYFKRLFRGFLNVRLFVPLFVVIALIAVTIPLYEHLVQKLIYYVDISGGWAEMLKPSIFLLLSLLYAKDKTMAFLCAIQIVVMSIVVGSDRLVIFSYFLFMYYALQVNRGINLGVIVSSLYFTVKGFGFMKSVFVCGEGFNCAFVI